LLDKLLERDDYDWCYNADACQDLVGNGVIEPALAVRTALQNVASVAALLIVTGALVAEGSKREAIPLLSAGAGIDVNHGLRAFGQAHQSQWR
jgi:chaperonin GroEL (HSP60 family)